MLLSKTMLLVNKQRTKGFQNLHRIVPALMVNQTIGRNVSAVGELTPLLNFFALEHPLRQIFLP